jgi:hypothetical protein
MRWQGVNEMFRMPSIFKFSFLLKLNVAYFLLHICDSVSTYFALSDARFVEGNSVMNLIGGPSSFCGVVLKYGVVALFFVASWMFLRYFPDWKRGRQLLIACSVFAVFCYLFIVIHNLMLLMEVC